MTVNRESDDNFRCGCGRGLLVPAGLEDGRLIYECDSCERGGQRECPICHRPRTLWMVDKQVCFFCGNGSAKLRQDITAVVSGDLWPLISNLLSYLGVKN